MAEVNHSSLTDPNLHEPKGVAAASAKQVYLSDGSGSGDWVYWPTGWGFYADDASGGQVFNTTASKLQIDGAGSNSEIGDLPAEIRGSGALWDTTNDKITPMYGGDLYEVRVNLPVTAKSGSPNSIFVELDMGGASSPTTVIVERTIAVPSSTPYGINFAFPIFISSTFLTNGGQIFLKTDTGTVTVTQPDILITRIHGGNSF